MLSRFQHQTTARIVPTGEAKAGADLPFLWDGLGKLEEVCTRQVCERTRKRAAQVCGLERRCAPTDGVAIGEA
jgi:hypothetical protein